MTPIRRAYVDWLRGIAVLSMIEWHVIDAWSIQHSRDGVAWAVIRTVGGFAAPLFLFLAGLAVPFAIRARQSRGADAAQAAWLVQKRGWQIFGLAHLFRFQSFLFNPNARWPGLLKPDILNILGLGLAGTAWLVARATTAKRRLWWLLLPTVAVIALTPLSRHWWWPTLLHPRLESYIRPVGNLGVFSLFPWVAFVPAGAFIGALLAEARGDADERRLLRQLAMFGAAAVTTGVWANWLGPVAHVEFWTAHASVFLIKTGAMMIALGVSWWCVGAQPVGVVEPVLLFGRVSLFVYWVHVELAYGVISYPLHYALPLAWSVPAFVLVTCVMYIAAGWWAKRPAGPWIPRELAAIRTE